MKVIKKLSLKLKLTLLFVLLFSGLLMIFSYFLYQENSLIRQAEFDANLYNYAIDVAESLDVDNLGVVEFDPGIIKINEKIFPFTLGKSFISVLDIKGKLLAHSLNSKLENIISLDEFTVLKVLKKGVSYSRFDNKEGNHFRVINYLLPVLKVDTPLILQISVPTISMDQANIDLKKHIIFSIILIIFLSFFVGYAFMQKALRPIVEITKKANEIDYKNLNDRVPVPFSEDEITDLAKTINNLLERLNSSFNSQERFVQDASHQLKTPLAIIKGEIEIFKQENKQNEQVNNFIESLFQEVNSLIKLTNNLLLLARVDNREYNLNLTVVNIDEILLSQISRLSKFASIKNISLKINFDQFYSTKVNDQFLLLDSELIGVMFYNLIENAIKYSPNGSCIEINIIVDHLKHRVEIKDQGKGLKVGMESKIFDRFYRDGHTSATEGSGLGLSICKAIAILHKVNLSAFNNPNGIGTTFYIDFFNNR